MSYDVARQFWSLYSYGEPINSIDRYGLEKVYLLGSDPPEHWQLYEATERGFNWVRQYLLDNGFKNEDIVVNNNASLDDFITAHSDPEVMLIVGSGHGSEGGVAGIAMGADNSTPSLAVFKPSDVAKKITNAIVIYISCQQASPKAKEQWLKMGGKNFKFISSKDDMTNIEIDNFFKHGFFDGVPGSMKKYADITIKRNNKSETK